MRRIQKNRLVLTSFSQNIIFHNFHQFNKSFRPVKASENPQQTCDFFFIVNKNEPYESMEVSIF